MDIASREEAELRLRADDLVRVREEECLACYLDRMLQEFGCAGHRFSEHWRAAQRRPMPALLRWLTANGGCCCDCEVVMNVFGRGRRSKRHERLQCRANFDRCAREWSA